MKLIVGLGNPGHRYRNTRHNVGFMVLDCLAEGMRVAFSQEMYQGLVAKGKLRGESVMLLKPLTFVNNSGQAVAEATEHTLGDLEDLLVVLDDVYLPLGAIRIRPGGSAGGHNGLNSIIEHLGTKDVPRLRMGVGENRGESSLTGHVLGKFTQEEVPHVETMVARAAEAVTQFVASGIERAMNEFN